MPLNKETETKTDRLSSGRKLILQVCVSDSSYLT